jgi:ABC-type uncharacterized transport system involved in gliding motility auxiliary subunit
MRRLWSSLVGVLAVAAILVGINVLVDTRLANAQLDLTQQHLYTLSKGTRTIIDGLKEPVTLRLYYSRALGTRIPAYGAYADRVRQMLLQYASLARGKVKIEFYDPEPFSDTEDHATAYGLQGVPVDNSGEQVYFGLAGSNLLDDERTIAFFQADREPFLEYDLTKLIYELSNPTRPVVGVMSSLPLDGDPRAMMMRNPDAGGQPYASMLQLRQTVTVKNVPLDAQIIDPDIKVLLLAQAQNLSDPTLYAIDQFVMRGGRLMVMVDPDNEEQNVPDPQTGAPPASTSSDLPKLFAAWGIEYDPTKVVADLTGAWRVRGSPSDQVQAVDYIAWFNIRDGIAHDDPATADLSQVTVASTGFIAKKPGSDIEFSPLLSTDNQSEVLPVATVKDNPDPAAILAAFKPDGQRRVIAARIRGVLKSAFTGPPPLPAGVKRADGMPNFKAQTDGPANMVVVADTDLLADRFWVRTQNFFGQQTATPFSDNGPFVANLIGTLSGSDALIGLRSRGTSVRPFTLVDDMQQKAEAHYRQTEKALQAHLDETQKKLTDLRSGQGDAAGSAVLTDEQRAAIDDLRRDVATTRNQLRGVQLELRRDISNLQNELRLFDIVMVPAILAIIAVVLGIVRSRRRARARA